MKRALNMGKHTSTSSALRSKLEALFRQPGVDRIIIGISDGCKHSRKDGDLKFQRQENKKLYLNGYGSAGVTRLVIILKDDANSENIKKWIEETNS